MEQQYLLLISREIFLHLILFVLKGVSATYTCLADGNEVVSLTNSGEVTVITNIPAVPRCIRCAYSTNMAPFIVFVTDPNDVMYFSGGSTQIMNGTINNVIVFDDGLLVEDPASSFSNDDTIRCEYNDGSQSGSRTLKFIIADFLPPPITPNGTVLDYVEGDNVTLTCTGNSNLNDEYQWTLLDGSTVPSLAPIGADNGLDVELKNVNRTDSGEYNCTGTISGTSISVVSNVTLNIQYPARVLSLVGNSANLSIGSLLILNCSFEGNPTPTISWSHNGDIVPSDNITDNYAILKITLDSSQSFGEYTCTVNNTNPDTADSMTYSVPESDSSTSTRTTTAIASTSEVITPSLSPSSSVSPTVVTDNVGGTVSPAAYAVPIVLLVILVLGVGSIVTVYVFMRRGKIHKDHSDGVDLANFSSHINYVEENTNVWDPVDDTIQSSNTPSNTAPPSAYASVTKKGDQIVIDDGRGVETPPTSVSFNPPLHEESTSSLPSYESVTKMGNRIIANEGRSAETPPPTRSLPAVHEEITIPVGFTVPANATYAEVIKKKSKKTQADVNDNGPLLEDETNDEDEDDTPPPIVPYDQSLLTPKHKRKQQDTIVYAELGEVRSSARIKPPSPQEPVVYSTLVNTNIINPRNTPPPPLPVKRMSLKESRMHVLQDELSLSLSTQHTTV